MIKRLLVWGGFVGCAMWINVDLDLPLWACFCTGFIAGGLATYVMDRIEEV